MESEWVKYSGFTATSDMIYRNVIVFTYLFCGAVFVNSLKIIGIPVIPLIA